MPPLPAFHKFTHPPPPTKLSILTFPAPHILLVTLSRPKALNCINSTGHHELHAVWSWLDSEPELRVGIITGEGRAFCAGADLKEWSTTASSSSPRAPLPPSGFGGLSRRVGKKPVIAAVNGICFGGGCEMVVNCDIVLAAPSAPIGLPEVKRGVVALAGALPRLSRIVGRMRAMEMALTGREISAGEAREWGLCNGVAERDGWGEMKGGVVDMAVEWAGRIAGNSPDSVVVCKRGVELGWEGVSAEVGTSLLEDGEQWKRMEGAENMREGLRAFVEKRPPRWVGSKL